MSWHVIALCIVLFILIPVALPLISRFLTKKWVKHDIKKQIQMKTRVGNMWYVINWVMVVGWITFFAFMAITQVDKNLSIDSIGGLCMMTFITVMLIRELHQSYKSRHSA